jgi:hypothetical protein
MLLSDPHFKPHTPNPQCLPTQLPSCCNYAPPDETTRGNKESSLLTMVEKERKVCVSHCLVDVHIPAHHHGALAPQLQRARLQAARHLSCDAPSNLCAACERDLRLQHNKPGTTNPKV